MLASPVFADVNNDGTKEMFLAISFYHTSKWVSQYLVGVTVPCFRRPGGHGLVSLDVFASKVVR